MTRYEIMMGKKPPPAKLKSPKLMDDIIKLANSPLMGSQGSRDSASSMGAFEYRYRAEAERDRQRTLDRNYRRLAEMAEYQNLGMQRQIYIPPELLEGQNV
jgi:hypothetical protein